MCEATSVPICVNFAPVRFNVDYPTRTRLIRALLRGYDPGIKKERRISARFREMSKSDHERPTEVHTT